MEGIPGMASIPGIEGIAGIYYPGNPGMPINGGGK